ncbi:secreted RxLR effector protein 161-like [Solanum dulcamara]|uniref:secreted RxLR effector protein 161-like n=1 Tax=Solanum dulcamara TaxID=45834 RepID=UPI002485B417|nr:secreted RxLR effector protein 161-like [Solanum dulcamara]
MEKEIHALEENHNWNIVDLPANKQAIGLGGARPTSTPLEANRKLTTVDYDAHVGNKADPEVEGLVLIQFMQRPKQSHLDASIRVVRYLKGSPGLGLFFLSNTTLELAIYCDYDWEACTSTRRSVTGYVVKLGGALLSWKSKKQQTVSRSSTKAEYRSMAMAVAELTWVYGLLQELNCNVPTSVTLYYDNQAAYR